MKLKVIVVSPKYQINIGYIARVASNFGVKRLFFVSPRAKIEGKRSVMFAKHAAYLLEGAKTCRSLDDATRDCDIIVGTTGIRRRGGRNFGNTYSPEEILSKVGRKGDATVALIMGRDDTGLNAEEVDACDMLAYIGTDSEYPVLNISHALAIMLYVFTKEGFKPLELAEEGDVDANELKTLFDAFDKIAAKKKIRNRKAVRSAFRRVIRMSKPKKQEVHALITALK